MPNSIRGKNIPLNLLEIFSNTEVGALSLSFTKYNNPITLDNLSFQIGTIRLNMFTSYLLDILRILSEYKKAVSVPKIITTEGDFSPDGKTILDIQEYFYNYILKKIPDSEKTDSMLEYMEYLKKEINSKKKFSSKPEHFIINQIFSFFPKGFDFHFDYENIEVVAYDSNNKVSSKIIVPSSELIISISFTKIFVKLLELEVEVTDLNRCEAILEQLKDLAKDKFKVVQIVIEPCYKQIKDGIEPLLKDTNKEFKQILKNQNSSKNMSQNSPKNSQKNINPNYIQNVQENSPQEKSISQNYSQNINENSPQDKNISQNYSQNINENSPQNKNISQNYSQNINESSHKDKSINQNFPNNISMNQNSPQSQNLLNNEEEEDNNEELESNKIKYNVQIEEKSNNDKQSFINKQQDQQEMLYRRQKEKENEILMQNRKEKELMLKRQQQEREKEQQIQLQKQKDIMLKQQQLERQQKLLLQKQQQEEKRQKELLQNQLQIEQQKIAEAQFPQNNKSQTQLNLQQKNSIQQEQQKQELLLRQQQKKPKNKNVKKKNSKKPAPLANSPKNTEVQNSDEDDQKIPRDTQKTNKRFIGKKKDGSSYYNIYINTNNNKNNDLPQMKRENSSSSYNQMGHINPQIQKEYITYNAGANVRKKGNNNIKSNIKPTNNKRGNIHMNNK